MAIEAQAKITLRGGTEALRALHGVSRATSTTTKEARAQAKQQEQAQRAAIRAHNERMRAAQRESQVVAREAQKAARAKENADRSAANAAAREAANLERIQQRQAERYQRLAQRSADVAIRQDERITRQAAREAAQRSRNAQREAERQAKAQQEAWRRAGGFVGGAAAGALAGAVVANSTARGVTGVKDVKQRIMDANAFRERLVGVTGAAGMSADEREAVQGQVLSASKTTGKDVGDLVGVLETGHGQFNNLKFFADHLTEIATIARVAQSDTGDFAKAVGSVQQAFGLTGDEAIQAAYLMKASADKGSVELKDFARDFAAGAGIFAQNTKQTGLAGVRQFLGTAQGIATGQFGSAESSTRLERFAADINDVEVRKGLAGIGIKNVADKQGRVDVGKLLDQLGSNKKFQSAATRQGIFKETRSLQAVEALLAARSRVQTGQAGAVDFRIIANADEAAGRQAVASGFSTMQGEGFFQFDQEAAKMQADTVENLPTFNEQLLSVVKAGDSLEGSFGRLSLWADSIAAVGVGGVVGQLLGGGGGGGGFLGKAAKGAGGLLARAGGAVAGAAAGLGGMLATGATAVGAASAGAIAGFAGAGLAVGGAAGTLANEATGWIRDDGQTISDLIVSKLIERTRNGQLSSDGKRNADGTLVQATKEQTRVLQSIDSGLRAVHSKPMAGGKREPD